MRTTILFLLCLASAQAALSAAPKDMTSFAKSWKLRHQWPEPRKDEGGFLLGGANSDETLRNLKAINGIPIEELEKRMRPGGYSPVGFLGKDDHLIEVLRKDNDFVVDKKKSSHRKLALALEMMEDIGQKVSGQFADKAVQFLFRGQRYEYSVRISDGFQANPFSKSKSFEEGADEELTTSGSGIVTLKNLTNGKQLTWSTMMPFLIQRYGFYEGEGTKFRLAPQKIFALLPFLEKT